MSRLGLSGMYLLPMNRRWVDIHHRAMPMQNLDPAFAGFTIVQISDLHYSPVVWRRYLGQFVQWINELDPQMVVVTGDLITGGYHFANRIATLLSHLHPSHGVVCTFGNHDYSIYGKRENGEGRRRADFLETCLTKRGMVVLRNQTLKVKFGSSKKPLIIVGLDDEWSGNSDPAKAFAGIAAQSPVICLNHNPANVKELMDYPWQWMLAGHTHGRQLGHSRMGRTLYPHLYRHYTHGYYGVNGRHLYVNRGLSYGQRVRDWCRPEITVFCLESAG